MGPPGYLHGRRLGTEGVGAATDMRVNVHDELPPRGRAQQLQVAHHPRHESLVLRSIVLGVQDEDHASHVRTVDGHADGGLETELHGSTPSLESLRRGFADELLPSRVARFEDAAGEAAAGLEGELLGVVPEEGKVELVLGGEGRPAGGTADATARVVDAVTLIGDNVP